MKKMYELPYDSNFWIDRKTFWEWTGPDSIWEEAEQLLRIIPPVPSIKKLDYISIGDSRQCIGVWDDERYTPLFRKEFISFLNSNLNGGHI